MLAEKGLNLESVAGMLKGGKRGPAIVRGKGELSLMFRMAAHRVSPVMPPEDKPANKPMTSAELGLMRLWINEGASDDSDPGEAGNAAPRSIVLGDLPPGVQPINAVDMTVDGARVAAGRANLVQVYDVDSGLEIVSLGGHKDLIQSVRYSPDGQLLAAGSYQIVTIWTAPAGGSLKTLAGHGGPILALVLAPDGSTAYSGGQDKTIKVWNLAEGKLLRTFTAPTPVTALAMVPGGKMLLCGGSDGTVRWLDSADGRERILRKWHNGCSARPGRVHGFAVRSGAYRIGGGGWSRAGVHTEIRRLGGIFAGGAGWSQGTGAGVSHYSRRRRPSSPAVTTQRSGDGMHATAKLRGLALTTGHSGSIVAVAISPDGQMILTGSADRTARLFALSDGKLLRTFAHPTGRVHSVAFSPSGDRIASADERGGSQGLGDSDRPGRDRIRAHRSRRRSDSAANEGCVQRSGVDRVGFGRWNAQDLAIRGDVDAAQDAGLACLPGAGSRLQPGWRLAGGRRGRAFAVGRGEDLGGWQRTAGPFVAIAALGHGVRATVQPRRHEACFGVSGQVSEGNQRRRRQAGAVV